MTTLHERATALLEYLKDESHWETGQLASDADGHPVHPMSSRATCHCLLGAVAKVEQLDPERRSGTNLRYTQITATALGQAVYDALPKRLRTGHPSDDIYEFNDEGNHKAVVKLLRKVVKNTKES